MGDPDNNSSSNVTNAINGLSTFDGNNPSTSETVTKRCGSAQRNVQRHREYGQGDDYSS